MRGFRSFGNVEGEDIPTKGMKRTYVNFQEFPLSRRMESMIDHCQMGRSVPLTTSANRASFFFLAMTGNLFQDPTLFPDPKA